jgi:SAM-dependent methyltransferase
VHVQPGGTVHGFDLDSDQVAAARRLGGGRFEVADAEDLSTLPPGRYDLAVCRRLLLHVRSPVGVLRQMARLVRSGGAVAAIEPIPPEGLAGEILAVLGEAWLGSRLRELLGEAGLTHARVAPLPGVPPPLPTHPLDRDQFLAAGGTETRWEQWLKSVRPTQSLWGGIATVP